MKTAMKNYRIIGYENTITDGDYACAMQDCADGLNVSKHLGREFFKQSGNCYKFVILDGDNEIYEETL